MDERKVLAEDGSVFAAVDVTRSSAPGQPVDVEQVPHCRSWALHASPHWNGSALVLCCICCRLYCLRPKQAAAARHSAKLRCTSRPWDASLWLWQSKSATIANVSTGQGKLLAGPVMELLRRYAYRS